MRNVSNNVTRLFRVNDAGNRCPQVYYFYIRSKPWLRDISYEIWNSIGPIPFKTLR